MQTEENARVLSSGDTGPSEGTLSPSDSSVRLSFRDTCQIEKYEHPSLANPLQEASLDLIRCRNTLYLLLAIVFLRHLCARDKSVVSVGNLEFNLSFPAMEYPWTRIESSRSQGIAEGSRLESRECKIYPCFLPSSGSSLAYTEII
ncbi:hypothetical protein K0M31_013975 [Melipona bicolor]|uniref:Uncharacterized protein n=1 Tax=Melipona bicolor TaxID=60889 RepID=A0AA40G8B6_9HYME|nr:hypothetical protein K0M31_013975 [Melipona bicolor]